LLQLDEKNNSENLYPDLFSECAREDSYFSWKMMCVTLEDTKVLLEFFRGYAAQSNKGIEVLLDKVDFYEEEYRIL
jgi:hypothetical protein